MVNFTLVTLDQLVGHVGGSAEIAQTWIKRTGVKPTVDNTGTTVLTPGDAQRVIDAYEQDLREHQEAWSGYQRYLNDREQARIAASKAAYEVAVREGGRAEAASPATGTENFAAYTSTVSAPSPRIFGRAREIRADAERRFDRKHPEIDFDRFRKRGSNL